jgi:Ger(x)C family germination protein
MAVFKKDKMVGTLNQSETRGYLCVSNLIKDGVIDIDADNGKACLEFLKTKCKTNVEISDEGKLKVNLTVTQDSTIGELDGFEGLEMEDIINKLETEGAEAIKNEINASIDHAKKLNADYFGFNEAFEKKYGNKWKEYKDKWDRLFPELEINVNVKVTIKGSGRITVLDMLKEEK